MLVEMWGVTTVTQATTIEVAVMVLTAKRTTTVLVAVVGVAVVKITPSVVQARHSLGSGGWSFGLHSSSSFASCALPWDAEDIWGCVQLKDITVTIQAMIITMSILMSSLPNLYHRLSMLLIHRWDSQLQVTNNLLLDLTINHNRKCNTQLVPRLLCLIQQVNNPWCNSHPSSTSSNLPTLGMKKVNLSCDFSHY